MYYCERFVTRLIIALPTDVVSQMAMTNEWGRICQGPVLPCFRRYGPNSILVFSSAFDFPASPIR